MIRLAAIRQYLIGQRIPVLSGLGGALAFHHQHMSGRQFLNVAKKCAWRGCREESQIVVKRLFINLGRYCRVLQDRLDFGSKNESSIAVVKIERLDTDTIAREHKLSSLRVP